jgi:signal transduction histidine kinase/HAMP domain-containing protein
MKLKGMPRRLSNKLLLGLGAGMLLSSLIFLGVFVESYRYRIQEERSAASAELNKLFQFSLENAMLKRDLPGLREIISRLGQQPGILRVQIVNPALEVRFASSEGLLGHQVTLPDLGCTDCPGGVPALSPTSWLQTTGDGQTVLRSVNPIRNKPECKQCHGPAEVSPVNGILIVDREAHAIRTQALLAAAWMVGAGATVVFIVMGGTWIFLRRQVLTPVAALSAASRALAAGDLSARVQAQVDPGEELGALCGTFNGMAARLEESVAEIRAKEAFLKALMDTLPDGLRVIDENHTVIMANNAYAAQLQEDPARLTGVPCYAARGETAPCPPTLVTCPFSAIETEGRAVKYIDRHMRKDGGEALFEITAARLTLDGGGAEPRMLVIEAIRDLTEQVRYSQEQRLAEIGQLATGVAHEIYNPLASVRLGLQFIMKRHPEGESLDPDTYSYLRVVDGAVDKCIEITKRLLNLSQLPSQSTQLVSLSSIVPEVVSLLRYEAEQIGVEITLDLGPGDLRVIATDSDMRMLVLNLAQNAFHAMPAGGRFTLRGCIEDGHIVIEASDTGGGINPAVLPRIFDPFFSKRADGVEGTGLGLTICKAIVTRYGGTIQAESEAGHGATFTVNLPFAGEA